MFLSHLYISNTFRMTVLTINPNNKRKYSFYKASVQIREKNIHITIKKYK